MKAQTSYKVESKRVNKIPLTKESIIVNLNVAISGPVNPSSKSSDGGSY